MAVEVVAISCADECKQVLAIASGGNDPYTFAWNDGVTDDSREICATNDTTFTVRVTDTAIVDGEFPYEAQSVTTSVEARVLSCPVDGGVDATVVVPPADAGAHCLADPGHQSPCSLAQTNLFELVSIGGLRAARSYTLPVGGALPSYVGTMRLWGTDTTCTERVLLAEFHYDVLGARVCLSPEQDHARLLIELVDPSLFGFGYSCLLSGC